MIIACDFDGTLCMHEYPKIGKPRFPLIFKLIERKKSGDKIILWSCRAGADLEDAVAWCAGFGLVFDAVNRDVIEIINGRFGVNKSIKVYADIYLDDKNYDIEDFINEGK